MPRPTHPNPQFPDTRWTLVLQIRDPENPDARQRALSDLCEAYWPPVYAFVRSKGNAPADAEDLTQGFFAHLLAHNAIAQADADRGKLRTFLLASVKNYMTNEWKKAHRQKRGGDKTILSLDADNAETRFHPPERGHDLTPDKVYERQWALTLLDQVLKKLHDKYKTDGKAILFDTLKPYLTPGAATPPHAEVATQLDMSESAVKVAVHRLRQRYAKLLRETIADTLAPEEDPEQELTHLLNVFS
ncbi:MAG: sigma-70 family RNA polymerase sigma factor [Verrucomicrobiota bacterium]